MKENARKIKNRCITHLNEVFFFLGNVYEILDAASCTRKASHGIFFKLNRMLKANSAFCQFDSLWKQKHKKIKKFSAL